MGEPDPGPPVVAVPRPIDRRLRLGPFASANDAVRFACYAGAGALLAPFLSPYLWLPVVGIGFLAVTWRPEGESLDEQIGRWVVWRTRSFGRRNGGEATVTPPASHRGFLRLGPGRYATVLRTGGVPVAYRPPADLERTFRAYAELLRASEGMLAIRAGTVPLSPDPLVPAAAGDHPAELPARAGYRELVTVLCRRRRVRRVDLAISTREGGPAGAAHLEQRTKGMAERLAALGLRPGRLDGHGLTDAGHRFGWGEGRSGGR